MFFQLFTQFYWRSNANFDGACGTKFGPILMGNDAISAQFSTCLPPAAPPAGLPRQPGAGEYRYIGCADLRFILADLTAEVYLHFLNIYPIVSSNATETQP